MSDNFSSQSRKDRDYHYRPGLARFYRRKLNRLAARGFTPLEQRNWNEYLRRRQASKEEVEVQVLEQTEQHSYIS